MRLTTLLLLLAALPLTPVLAKDPPPRRLFISPMGQPFRTDDGVPEDAWFKAVDRDGDGRITLSEFTLDAARFFMVLDTDHDGIISDAEVRHYEQDIAPEIEPRQFGYGHDGDDGGPPSDRPNGGGGGGHHGGGPGGGPGGGMGGGMGGGHHGGGRHGGGGGMGGGGSGANAYLPPLTGAGRYGYIATPEPVTAADVNFDGMVTKAEFMAAATRRFEMLDGNQDGALTQRELPKLKANPDHERRRPTFEQDRPQSDAPEGGGF